MKCRNAKSLPNAFGVRFSIKGQKVHWIWDSNSDFRHCLQISLYKYTPSYNNIKIYSSHKLKYTAIFIILISSQFKQALPTHFQYPGNFQAYIQIIILVTTHLKINWMIVSKEWVLEETHTWNMGKHGCRKTGTKKPLGLSSSKSLTQ